MTKLVKIVDDKYVQIEEYRNPNICFGTNSYSNFENYCTLRQTFDPFEIFYEKQELELELSGYRQAILNNKEMLGLKEENEKLKKQSEEINKMIEKCGFVNIEQVMLNYCGLLSQQKEFINYMNSVIDVLKKEDVDDEELRGYIIQRIDTFKEILQKYKEIIGGK